MKRSTSFILAVLVSTGIIAQERKEVIKKNIDPAPTGAKTLWIDNINGSIVVKAWNERTVNLEVTKHVHAENEEKLETAWNRLNLAVETGDTIEVYIDGFCSCDCGKRKGHYSFQCDDEHGDDFSFDFIVRVPQNYNLRLATVNDGEVSVTGINGYMKINNVNGGITLEEVSGNSELHTINGDVRAEYTRSPETASSYYTLNGEITVYFPKDLSADLSFKSFNGEFYTDFNYSEVLPSRLVTSSDHESGTRYAIQDKTVIRIGEGSFPLEFETYNGDIYIRKK